MNYMKAWVLKGLNDLQLKDVPIPRLKDGETLVQVKTAGICASDLQRVFFTGAYHYPLILGHEFAGVTHDGRRVGVFPLLPCFECESCKSKRYESCSRYSYIGSRRDGGFAEYVAVPKWNMIELPDNISFDQAALLEPAAVALHAVKRLNFDYVKTAAVIGNGAIGSLIGKWLSVFGVPNIDILGRRDKPSFEQYDVCVEAAGSTDAFQRCMDLVRPNGQMVLVGNPNLEFHIQQTLYWQILRKQVTVYGSWNSSYPSDWQDTISNAGKLQLDHFISHRYIFEELDNAFEMLHNKNTPHLKVIVKNKKS